MDSWSKEQRLSSPLPIISPNNRVPQQEWGCQDPSLTYNCGRLPPSHFNIDRSTASLQTGKE